MPLVGRLRLINRLSPIASSPGSCDASLTSLARSSCLQQIHAPGCGCSGCSGGNGQQSMSISGLTRVHAPSCACAGCSISGRSQAGMHSCSQGCMCSNALHHQQAWGSSTANRAFSAAAGEKGARSNQEGNEEEEKKGEEDAKPEEEGGGEGQQHEDLNVEELLEKLKKAEDSAETAAEQVAQLTDSLKRNLAEMENLRMRTTREVENAKKFAIQSFLKNILDVADNLERAYGAVPVDALSEEEGKALEAPRLRILLKGMMGGVATTERLFLQALKQQGVQQFNPQGEKFDPNFHSALFEMVDPTKEPGQIGQVTKRGYTLHDRVIRPAEVGVVRAEDK